MNLIQQADRVFATFFVYGSDGRARRYVSSDMQGSGAGADQPILFRGNLYETNGPVVGRTFDPAAVTRRVAGSVTFEYHRPNDGILTYAVDGTAVSKRVTRQTWAMNEIAGDYWVKRGTINACLGGSGMTALGKMAVRRSGTSVTLSSEPGVWLVCQYSGTYSQEGRMGRITGSYTCTANDGGAAESGTFTLDEVEVSPRGLMARYSARNSAGGCMVFGNFAGARAPARF